MCGIIGIAQESCGQAERDAVVRGLQELEKRGPDGEGIYANHRVVLGHRRLSIIDLEGGAQPMQTADGTLCITFNGEIYNYRELRRELESQGTTFKSASDTEVILELYRAHGAKCVDYLDGMFAFAIWDEKEQQLFLARDRFGEKPLYLSHTDKGLVFASEIKGILATGLVRPLLDRTSLDNFLYLSFLPPWRTIYKNIISLRPGHVATFKNGTYTATEYWKLRHDPITCSFEEAALRTRAQVEASVRSRMVADVEVGTFLSGGMDSGIITLLATQADTSQVLKTFSMGFENIINELPEAQKLSERAGTEHFATQVPSDLAQAFVDACTYFDQPFADSGNIPWQLLSKFARAHVPVVLSGDGGDELFYGYGHYRPWGRLPFMQRMLREILSNPFVPYAKRLPRGVFSDEERRSLVQSSGWESNHLLSYMDLSEAHTPLQKINLVDFAMRLPGDILVKTDRSSMMHSLELRSPFLNHELAQFAFNLPDHYKSNHERGKLVLEQAFADLFPPEFFARKKQGFGPPLAHWLEKPEFRELVDRTFTPPDAPIYQLCDPAQIHSYITAFYTSKKGALKVWTLLALALWLNSHPRTVL